MRHATAQVVTNLTKCFWLTPRMFIFIPPGLSQSMLVKQARIFEALNGILCFFGIMWTSLSVKQSAHQ